LRPVVRKPIAILFYLIYISIIEPVFDRDGPALEVTSRDTATEALGLKRLI
jgi:hypothetical protein